MQQLIQDKYDLVKNLKDYREDADLSQQKVADKLHMERSTYTYYENGKTIPDIFTIIKLAKIFNVSLARLIIKREL